MSSGGVEEFDPFLPSGLGEGDRGNRGGGKPLQTKEKPFRKEEAPSTTRWVVPLPRIPGGGNTHPISKSHNVKEPSKKLEMLG
jgi:hypothetical protein